MNKTRLEAFSDGVLAIIITIMVLEIKVPEGHDWGTLKPLLPKFVSYVISFLLVGIYWGNHHHLLHSVKKVNSGIMFSNLLLLFSLSLVPVATGWVGENHHQPVPVVLYSIVSILCGIAYTLLQRCIIKSNPLSTDLRKALKRQDTKEYVSLSANLLAIPFAFVNTYISALLFIIQSVIWLVPDKHVERALLQEIQD